MKDVLIKKLADKMELLARYSVQLENSELNTRYKGEDIFFMIHGLIDGLTCDIQDAEFDFFDLIMFIQKEVNLDLGVCRYICRHEGTKDFQCQVTKNIIVNPVYCSPPMRIKCQYRRNS